MSHYSITLPVPDYIYDRARQIAAGTSQTVEAMLLQQLTQAFPESLPDLAPEEQRELKALAFAQDPVTGATVPLFHPRIQPFDA